MPALTALQDDPGRSAVEERLERLEREQIAVFAVREALRAAPLLAVAGPDRIEPLATPSFRAMLTACVATFEPDSGISAKSAADDALQAATLAEIGHSAIYAAARAATAAAATHASAAAYAGYAAACSAARAAAAETSILAEALNDLGRLERAFSAARLRAAPLWPFGVPEAFTEAVERLSWTLAQAGTPSALWTDWYAGKIEGWPEIHPFEREWAALPDPVWAGEPAALAAALSEIRRRHPIAGVAADNGSGD